MRRQRVIVVKYSPTSFLSDSTVQHFPYFAFRCTIYASSFFSSIVIEFAMEYCSISLVFIDKIVHFGVYESRDFDSHFVSFVVRSFVDFNKLVPFYGAFVAKFNSDIFFDFADVIFFSFSIFTTDVPSSFSCLTPSSI